MNLIQTTIAIAIAVAMTSCETTSKPTATPITPYPLETCIVSDEDLDSMGGAITKVHNGQEIKLCCKSCVKDFEESPAAYLTKLQ